MVKLICCLNFTKKLFSLKYEETHENRIGIEKTKNNFISKRKQKVRLSVTMATATYANSSPQRNSTKRSRYPN